jgi:CheY-like chemotaxis protein
MSVTLLVVEDDLDVRETLCDILIDEGYQVVQAGHGAEALARLRDGVRPHLILLDMMMPVMDGWAFRAAQRADPELAGIPVIVMTAHIGPQEATRDLEAVALLRKPIRLDALLAAIEGVVTAG